ncbi:class I SAM-dependent methyltransferase [Nocardia sp. IFM 10818]
MGWRRGPEVPDGERWNGNIHYHRLLMDAVPARGDVLDVGCGEGMLARRLHARGARVTGIDLDEPGIEQARKQSPGGEIEYVCGDFLSYPFQPESFDGIVSVATLHHMAAAAGLKRMRELLRPGGTLAVVGLARDVLPRDLPWVLAGTAAFTWHRLTKTKWEHPSPIVWPPPVTYREMSAIARDLLPGARFRRHVMWRYSLTWTKPSV